MFREVLLSIRDNFREKTTNPFLGTYIIVWLISNWELVYRIMNFDSSCQLECKVSAIKSYFNSNNFYSGVLYNILWTLLLLIITYTLLNLSRFIINLFEKRLKPWVYKITDSKSIVTRDAYEMIRIERDGLQGSLESERDAKSRLESRIKLLQGEIDDFNNKSAAANRSEFDDVEQKEIAIITNKLLNENLIDVFKKRAIDSLKNVYIDNSDSRMDRLLRLGLFEAVKQHPTGISNTYKLTRIGHGVVKLIESEDLR